MREARAHEVVDVAARARRGDDFVHARRFVEDRDRGEVEAGDFPRRLYARVDDVLFAHRRAEGASSTIKLTLLDLRPFELEKDSLVLDGAQAKARRLRGDVLFVRRKGSIADSVDREDSPQRLPFEHRNRRECLHRTRARVVGNLV